MPRRDPSLESRCTEPHGADPLKVTIASFAVLRLNKPIGGSLTAASLACTLALLPGIHPSHPILTIA